MREAPAPAPAENFVMHSPMEELATRDELIIDQNLTGVDYKLAKCCNHLRDEIFAFVSSQESEFIGLIVLMRTIFFPLRLSGTQCPLVGAFVGQCQLFCRFACSWQ